MTSPPTEGLRRSGAAQEHKTGVMNYCASGKNGGCNHAQQYQEFRSTAADNPTQAQ